MDVYDSRKKSRRATNVRRIAERRTVAYPFASPEWVANIKKNYLSWPKVDRRINNRRTDERRSLDRRLHQYSEQRRSEQKYSKILLTQEERNSIAEIYRD